MDIVKIARTAGLQILLDARIGRETYHSVSGSLSSLQRFADAVCAAVADEPAAGLDHVEHGEESHAQPGNFERDRRASWR